MMGGSNKHLRNPCHEDIMFFATVNWLIQISAALISKKMRRVICRINQRKI